MKRRRLATIVEVPGDRGPWTYHGATNREMPIPRKGERLKSGEARETWQAEVRSSECQRGDRKGRATDP